jgi:hypothetical protein
MRRAEIDEPSTQGQDSFLDVVANMVGIMILLVMVVGLRASKVPTEPLGNGAPQASRTRAGTLPASGGADGLPRQVAQLQSDVAKLARQVAAHEEAESLRELERVHLASHAIQVQAELDRREAELTAAQRAEHQLVQSLAATRNRLDELTEEQLALASIQPTVETIENLPTPLAETVRGDEVHLRLKGGLVSVIPLEELVKGLEQHVRDHTWKLASQSSLEETLGPVAGYRLRYRLVHRRVVVQSAAGPINRGDMVQLEGWELLPMADDLGQVVEQAVLPDSELRKALKGKRPETTTITVWTYPDSFNELRRLKQSLFELGFATAARPLPDGIRIGGSPHGTKSAAQ